MLNCGDPGTEGPQKGGRQCEVHDARCSWESTQLGGHTLLQAPLSSHNFGRGPLQTPQGDGLAPRMQVVKGRDDQVNASAGAVTHVGGV